MEDALMAVCWLVTAGHLQHSCRQFCRHNAGGGPLMEGILGHSWISGPLRGRGGGGLGKRRERGGRWKRWGGKERAPSYC